GMLVKEITPVLHRLQEAFLIYEDQFDGEWDRGWHKFSDMFPDVNITKYTRHEALKILLRRFAYRHVVFNVSMAKSFYKLPEKDIKNAALELVADGIFMETDNGYILEEDYTLPETYTPQPCSFIYAMHRSDFLVKSNEHWLKQRYTHSYPDTLYYLMVDGEFCGAVVGKFRYTPEVEDVMVDLPAEEAILRKTDILRAIHYLCGEENPIRRYQGVEITL
ncbi:MAG: hypothetical protein FWC32_03765, partial [Firmicutes bacterium]|nr:hypothetical protein [Bacillota bacterium]